MVKLELLEAEIQDKFNDLVVLTYTLMPQVVVYFQFTHTHTHVLQEKHNSLEVKITTFFDDLLTVHNCYNST
jgi:hypothetical protein